MGHKHRGAIQQDSEPYLLLPLVCVCSYLNFSLTSLEKRPKKPGIAAALKINHLNHSDIAMH